MDWMTFQNLGSENGIGHDYWRHGKATYTLEGDGSLAFITNRQISKLHSVVSCQLYPNVLAVAQDENQGNASEHLLIQYAKSCAQPAYDYI